MSEELEIDEPTEQTVDPYKDVVVKDGVGVNDPEATELDPEVK